MRHMPVYYIGLDEPIRFFIAGEFIGKAGWSHARYEHYGDFELMLGLSGHFDLTYHHVDGDSTPRTVRVSPSACVLLPPRIILDGGTRAGDDVDFIWLHFLADRSESQSEGDTLSMPVSHAALRQIGNGEYCPELDDICVIPERFVVHDMNRVLLAARNLLACVNSRRYTQRANDLLVATLLIELSDDYLSALTQSKGESTRLVPIIEWIRTNMSPTLSVAAIADHFAMNPDYLNRLFRQERGTTVRDYLINLRIETAKALLIRTDYPIKTVAKCAFFNDVRNFMKQFKQRTSMTPASFRTLFASTYVNTPYVDPALPVPHDVGELIKKGMD